MEDTDKLFEKIISGDVLASELTTMIPEKKDRALAYSKYLEAHFPLKSPTEECEGCGVKNAQVCIPISWQVKVKSRFLKTFGIGILLFPFVLLLVAASPIIFEPNIDIGPEFKFLKTHHSLCNSCMKRFKVGGILGGVVMFLLGIPLVFSFAAAIISGFVTVASFFGMAELDMRIGWWALAVCIGSSCLTWILQRGIVLIPIWLKFPKSIRHLERFGVCIAT